MTQQQLDNLSEEYTSEMPWIATPFEEGQYQDAYQAGFLKALELVMQHLDAPLTHEGHLTIFKQFGGLGIKVK